MAIEPKTTREHILSLYGHISGVKKNLKHVHEDVDKLGGKIDKDLLGSFDCCGNCSTLRIRKDV
jgi:hypothetical protein